MLVSIFLPWPIRCWFLNSVFNYQIDQTAHIGFAWVFPKSLVMEKQSSIGHFTVCKGQDLIKLSEHASIGRLNWITSYPSEKHEHFTHRADRRPSLIVGAHSAITNRHLIDCTDNITIGKFSIFAGFQSQILTHSIDLKESRQSCAPVKIGDYCFVGTSCVVLGGAVLPDYSVLGAKSLLNHVFSDVFTLYVGVPARAVKALERSDKFFAREEGFVK